MSRRRGNNEGSLSKRADGRWLAQVTMPDGSRKSAYGKTRTEATAKLKALQTEVERAGRLMPGTTYKTVGEFLTAWLAIIEQNRAPNTFRYYRQNIVNYCQELMPVPLTKLTPQHLQKLLTKRMDDGLSSATVHHVYSTLHVALEFAMRQGLFERNLADFIDPPRQRRYEHKTLTASQAHALLEAVKGHRLEALIVMAISTGMRPGEILGLRWSDVDFAAGEIRIQRNIQRVDGVTESKETKSESSRRRILLTAMAQNALFAHKQRQDNERVVLENQWDDSWGLVFCTLHGKPLHASYVVHRVYQPALARAGLPHIRFYDLRHTAATLLMEAGVHPKVVSEMLGHSSISLTLGTYTHVLPPMHAHAVDKMNTLLTASEQSPLLRREGNTDA